MSRNNEAKLDSNFPDHYAKNEEHLPPAVRRRVRAPKEGRKVFIWEKFIAKQIKNFEDKKH